MTQEHVLKLTERWMRLRCHDMTIDPIDWRVGQAPSRFSCLTAVEC
jgi:hypothetical protein